ncbi:inositol-tetrakisphosphate 1-kinase 4 isoform X2 [Coffea arabica]|uniref:Inositol-tetrakisphosphate 1-kinase n=1 Tax=Coffea arabica TaxID=13443 RepID=A0A6P6WB38_COFAR|nr:inositol-tetrakisphosphate 1-kinase 2-like isoform X2 [Coffea arabica]
MRLNGEISIANVDDDDDGDGERKENELGLIRSPTPTAPPTRLVVGYALTSKKRQSFLQPKLLALARSKGILFIAVDVKQPLSDQGPFDVVLHKLAGKEWSQMIEDYGQKNPNVTVLDPPDAIEHVNNRQSMLEDVADLNLPDYYGNSVIGFWALKLLIGRVTVPRQLVFTTDPSSIPHEVTKEGLKLPLVAKPLVVDGSAKSHELFLAYDKVSLAKLEPPLVLQEFVNHGGVLFKVYIIGEFIKVVRRFSLPDVCKRELSKIAGVFPFPRVSCASASADGADLDPKVAELPPSPLLEMLARELRLRLLFNVDIIREYGTRDLYYIIDINYFPGYGKMPDYEHTFTEFLLSLEQSKYEKVLVA